MFYYHVMHGEIHAVYTSATLFKFLFLKSISRFISM